MASLYPAEAIGQWTRYGRLGPGTRADIVHLSDDLEVGKCLDRRPQRFLPGPYLRR